MPQMKPSLWVMLMLFTLSIISIIIMMTYYISMNLLFMKKKSNIIYKKNMKNWKWMW